MKSSSLVLAIATLLAGCAPDEQRTADRTDTSRLTPATADGDVAPKLLVPNGTIPTRSGRLQVERLAVLEEPWGMAFLPDGRLLITEKPGRLRIFHEGKLSAPVAGVSDEEVIPMGRRIRNIAQARDGSLLALSESPNAELLRLSPAP